MSIDRFRIDGLAEALRNIEQFPKKLQRRIINGALRDSSKPILQATRKNAPKRGGALRRSVRPTEVRAGRIGPVLLIRVGVLRKIKNRRTKMSRTEDAFYAKFVEMGTKGHPIVARGKRLKVGNRFFMRVSHPGARRRDFFRRSIDSAAGTAMGDFARQVRARLSAVRSASSL